MFATTLMEYPDQSYRMISTDKIEQGNEVTFQNARWINETRIVENVLEERPAKGEWKEITPTSYHLKFKVAP